MYFIRGIFLSWQIWNLSVSRIRSHFLRLFARRENRQNQNKFCSDAGLCVDLDGTAMGSDDIFYDGQAETGAGRLVGDKGIKNSGQTAGINPCSRIADGKDQALPSGFDVDDDLVAGICGLQSIFD